jgi:hypothetical protein
VNRDFSTDTPVISNYLAVNSRRERKLYEISRKEAYRATEQQKPI